MIVDRKRIKRWINKAMRAAGRLGEDFDVLCAEVKKERLPPTPSDVEVPAQLQVPAKWTEEFKKYVADTSPGTNHYRQGYVPRFRAVAYALNLPPDMTDSEAARRTAEALRLANPEDPRHVRRLIKESTDWFQPKK
jgi:hypothetical protein